MTTEKITTKFNYWLQVNPAYSKEFASNIFKAAIKGIINRPFAEVTVHDTCIDSPGENYNFYLFRIEIVSTEDFQDAVEYYTRLINFQMNEYLKTPVTT